MDTKIRPVLPLKCCDVPTIYNNKQSYYEVLCYLGYKINECIETLNDFTDDYKEYTDTEITKLKDYVDESLNELSNSLNTKIDSEVDRIDSEIEELSKSVSDKISKLTSLIYEVNNNLKIWTEWEIEKIYNYIDKIQCNNIKCYNPTTGYYEPLCKVLSNIYDALRYCGITASEYDNMHITAEQYDDIYITAVKYDLYAKCLLFKSPWFYMFSPVSGEYKFYQDVINELADLIKPNPITASEYDALNITADSYDEKEVTAKNYDFEAKTILSE